MLQETKIYTGYLSLLVVEIFIEIWYNMFNAMEYKLCNDFIGEEVEYC